MDAHWTVKCGDFGLSREVFDQVCVRVQRVHCTSRWLPPPQGAETRIGTVSWSAPEARAAASVALGDASASHESACQVIRGVVYNEKCDLWSFGVGDIGVALLD